MAVYVSNRADHAKSDAVTVRRLRCGECSVSAASPAAPSGQVVGELIGDSALRIWGLSPQERCGRQLARFGVAVDGASATAQHILLLRADWVFDDILVRGLVEAEGSLVLLGADEAPVALKLPIAEAEQGRRLLAERRAPASVRTVTAATLGSAYNDVLRKREAPYLLPLNPENHAAVEKRVFGGAYKGVTDLVTLYLWPRPARAVTHWCARLGISPNQVTSLSLLLVLLAMYGFWTGHYVLGLLAAWPMTFLDTVDGKLARVTVRSSPFGNVFDHSIDLIHPPFWWWAWIVGLPAAGFSLPQASLVLGVIVAGYVLQRLEEGLFITWIGMEMHVWERFDSRFRLITARRNPNLLLLTASVLFGRPDLGILAVAVWTVLCLLVHALRLIQALLAKRRGPLRSWLASAS